MQHLYGQYCFVFHITNVLKNSFAKIFKFVWSFAEIPILVAPCAPKVVHGHLPDKILRMGVLPFESCQACAITLLWNLKIDKNSQESWLHSRPTEICRHCISENLNSFIYASSAFRTCLCHPKPFPDPLMRRRQRNTHSYCCSVQPFSWLWDLSSLSLTDKQSQRILDPHFNTSHRSAEMHFLHLWYRELMARTLPHNGKIWPQDKLQVSFVCSKHSHPGPHKRLAPSAPVTEPFISANWPLHLRQAGLFHNWLPARPTIWFQCSIFRFRQPIGRSSVPLLYKFDCSHCKNLAPPPEEQWIAFMAEGGIISFAYQLHLLWH